MSDVAIALVRRIIRRMVREVYHRKANALSLRYKASFHPHLGCSQSGEDGILREMFRRLGIGRGWFVDVGAGDGVLYSNTYALTQQGWRGIGIECDADTFRNLQRNMALAPDYAPLYRRVSLDAADRLDAILAQTPIPREFDLLSIDIDGNDYWIWESLRDYRPGVVAIEYNPLFSAREHKTLPFDKHRVYDGCSDNYGASAAALEKLGRCKGYRLVAYTGFLNLMFVREDLTHGTFERLPVTCVPAAPRRLEFQPAAFIDV